MKKRLIFVSSLVVLMGLVSCQGDTGETSSSVNDSLVSSSIPNSSSNPSGVMSQLPVQEIKEYLKANSDLPSYEATEYDVLFAVKNNIKYVKVESPKSETASEAAYRSILEAAGYVYSDDSGTPYYLDQIGGDYAVELKEIEAKFTVTVYNLEQYTNGGSSVEGTSNVFPQEELKAYLSTSANLPEYVSDMYGYEGSYDNSLGDPIPVFSIYSNKTESVSASAYNEIMTRANYKVDYDKTQDAYTAVSEKDNYCVIFYDSPTAYGQEILVSLVYNLEQLSAALQGGGSSVNTSTTFPQDFVKETLGTKSNVPEYVANEYQYASTVSGGLTVAMIASLKSETACVDAYKPILEAAQYTVNYNAEMDTYIGVNSEYVIFFYETAQTNGTIGFFLEIVSYSDFMNQGSTSGTSDTFPSAVAQQALGVDEAIIAFEAPSYNYEHVTDPTNECFYIESLKSETACNTAYKKVLEDAGYTVTEKTDTDGTIIFHATKDGSNLEYFFYEVKDANNTEYFCVQIYARDKAYTSTIFPQSEIQNYFPCSETFPEFSASKYTYMLTVDDQGYKMVAVAAEVSTDACNTAYKKVLEDLGFVVKEKTDANNSTFYVAESENSRYQIIFFENQVEGKNYFFVQGYCLAINI